MVQPNIDPTDITLGGPQVLGGGRPDPPGQLQHRARFDLSQIQLRTKIFDGHRLLSLFLVGFLLYLLGWVHHEDQGFRKFKGTISCGLVMGNGNLHLPGMVFSVVRLSK